jgi:hypothetical protein
MGSGNIIFISVGNPFQRDMDFFYTFVLIFLEPAVFLGRIKNISNPIGLRFCQITESELAPGIDSI